MGNNSSSRIEAPAAVERESDRVPDLARDDYFLLLQESHAACMPLLNWMERTESEALSSSLRETREAWAKARYEAHQAYRPPADPQRLSLPDRAPDEDRIRAPAEGNCLAGRSLEDTPIRGIPVRLAGRSESCLAFDPTWFSSSGWLRLASPVYLHAWKFWFRLATLRERIELETAAYSSARTQVQELDRRLPSSPRS
jgi:hypothetical protein